MKYLKNIYNKLGKKALIALFILAAVDVFVISAPYYIRLIIPNVHLYLHVTESDLANFLATIGWVTLITQLPGGWLADKISSKKLTSLASISTGLLTIWWASLILRGTDPQPDSDGQLVSQNSVLIQYYLIYIGWGVSTTLIFWTPLWKLVSQQAKKEDQGIAYGVQGAFNGIIGVLLIFLVGLLAAYLTQNIFNEAFAVYAFLVAFYLITTGIAILLWVPEYTTKQKFALDFKTSIEVIKNPRLWLNSFFVMGMYMFQSVFAYYLLQYITNVSNAQIQVPVIVFSVIGGLRTYAFRFVLSAPIGRWADKTRSYILFLLITLGLGFVLASVFLLLPGFQPFATLNSSYQSFVGVFLIILYLLTGILSWVMVTLRYATIGELPAPKSSYASVNALISFVAFSPDAWFYTASGKIGKIYTEAGKSNTSQLGYSIILIFAISVAIFGWICGLVVYFWNTKELKKLGKTDYRWRTLENV